MRRRRFSGQTSLTADRLLNAQSAWVTSIVHSALWLAERRPARGSPMSDVSSAVISRKIESARRVNTPLPRLTDVLAELTKRIEKQVRGYLGTVVEAMIMDVETKTFSDVLDSMSMPAMIGIVDIDGVDRSAIVNMDLDLVYHIVDLRLGGSPAEYPEFGARRPTGIDNALCSPVVDMIVSSLSEGLTRTFGAEEVIPMRCTTFEHLPMLAAISHEKSDVLSIKVSLDVGEAARSGDFELVMPFASLDVIKNRLKQTSTVSSAHVHDAWADHMLTAVLDTDVELTPVVFSTQMPVAELARLEVGSVIELPTDAHHSVALTLETPSEPLQLANARLGAFEGHKALKLTADPDPDFLNPLRLLTKTVHS